MTVSSTKCGKWSPTSSASPPAEDRRLAVETPRRSSKEETVQEEERGQGTAVSVVDPIEFQNLRKRIRDRKQLSISSGFRNCVRRSLSTMALSAILPCRVPHPESVLQPGADRGGGGERVTRKVLRPRAASPTGSCTVRQLCAIAPSRLGHHALITALIIPTPWSRTSFCLKKPAPAGTDRL